MHTHPLISLLYRLAFRHRNSWQDSARIKLNRADMVKFLWETSKALNVNFLSPLPSQIVFQGGKYENGAVTIPDSNAVSSALNDYKGDKIVVGASNVDAFSGIVLEGG
jgi:hypothetical protein